MECASGFPNPRVSFLWCCNQPFLGPLEHCFTRQNVVLTRKDFNDKANSSDGFSVVARLTDIILGEQQDKTTYTEDPNADREHIGYRYNMRGACSVFLLDLSKDPTGGSVVEQQLLPWKGTLNVSLDGMSVFSRVGAASSPKEFVRKFQGVLGIVNVALDDTDGEPVLNVSYPTYGKVGVSTTRRVCASLLPRAALFGSVQGRCWKGVPYGCFSGVFLCGPSIYFVLFVLYQNARKGPSFVMVSGLPDNPDARSNKMPSVPTPLALYHKARGVSVVTPSLSLMKGLREVVTCEPVDSLRSVNEQAKLTAVEDALSWKIAGDVLGKKP